MQYSKCDCGLRKPTEVNDWPWMASLGNSTGHFCGGSVIGRKWIITAASCLRKVQEDGSRPPKKYRKKDIKIYLGGYGTTIETQVYYVDSYKIPKKFGKEPWSRDIAVIKVKGSIDLNLYTPVCLPKKSKKNKTFVGSNATVVGWEAIASDISGEEFDQFTESETFLGIFDSEVCSKAFPNQFSKIRNICAVAQVGASACGFDSGRSMTVEDRRGRHTLVGISSHYKDKKCDGGSYTFFTSVSFYRKWIEKMTGI